MTARGCAGVMRDAVGLGLFAQTLLLLRGQATLATAVTRVVAPIGFLADSYFFLAYCGEACRENKRWFERVDNVSRALRSTYRMAIAVHVLSGLDLSLDRPLFWMVGRGQRTLIVGPIKATCAIWTLLRCQSSEPVGDLLSATHYSMDLVYVTLRGLCAQSQPTLLARGGWQLSTMALSLWRRTVRVPKDESTNY